MGGTCRPLIVFAAIVALAAMSRAASAADVPQPQPVAPPAAAPAYNWYGFFIGGHAGYAWSNESVGLAGGPTFTPNSVTGQIPSSIGGNTRGFIGGVQYGSNWQFDRFVVGTESDLSFMDRKTQATVTSTAGGLLLPPVTTTGDQSLERFGTSRVRAGFTLTDNLLLYATGGLANGSAEVNVATVTPGGFGVGSKDKTLWGWAAGAGIEYGWDRWSVKVEYLHYDLGDMTFTYFVPSGPTLSPITSTTQFTGDIVRFGVNYRFNWTPWDLLTGRRSLTDR